MNVCLIHYHMKPGGVATVIKQQFKALKGKADTMLLCGYIPDGSPYNADTTIIDGLNYDSGPFDADKAEKTAEEICGAIEKRFGSTENCDVVHVHNPTLCKNVNFIHILSLLQDKGLRLFLQIHDFAEDGRAAAYYFNEEYPSKCHYGVINSRDYELLIKSGLHENALHKIFNIVNFFDEEKIKSAKKDSKRKTMLYPIRAIRRKNIGEAILLSLIFPHYEVALTLPPNSSADMPQYEGWTSFARERGLNVRFNAGADEDFYSLVSNASMIITTSINEGFGFSFLEGWTADKAVFGRRIDFVCRDFEQNGVDMSFLYESLRVPESMIDGQKLFERWREAVLSNARSFSHEISDDEIQNAFDKLLADATLDFGFLDEEFQKRVIDAVLKDGADEILRLNPKLNDALQLMNKNYLIARNKAAVKNFYNEENYGSVLMDIYRKVKSVETSHEINKKTLLKNFFNLEEFRLLKWGEYHESE